MKRHFQVQIAGDPDPEWDGVTSETASLHESGALIFHNGTQHIITYAAHAWLTYFEGEQ